MNLEEIEDREFALSLRGYARDEVDTFKVQVAQALRAAKQELQDALTRLDESHSKQAVAARQLADAQAQLQVAVASPQPPSVEEAELVLSDERNAAFRQVGQETEKILMAAEQVAEEMIERAAREAAGIVADARMLADRTFAEIEEAKRAAEDELQSIREARGMIASQMEDIGRRLSETVARLRVPVESPGNRPGGRPRQVPGERQVVREHQAAAERQAAERQAAERQAAERQAAERQAAERQAAERQAAEHQTAERQAAEHQTAERQAAEHQTAERQAAEHQTAERQAAAKSSSLTELLDEIRRNRDSEAPTSPEGETKATPAESPTPVLQLPVEVQAPTAPPGEVKGAGVAMLEARSEALGDLPVQTFRRLKRLLQEDHNDLLDRLRTQRGKGSVEENLAPLPEQFGRFQAGLTENLSTAFSHGRRAGGGLGTADPAKVVSNLVARQVVNPLRSEVSKAIQGGLQAQDTAPAIAERASDVFRVWKGVRTELLGEGMVYAAFNQGLVDAWSSRRNLQKIWVSSDDEDECPNGVCAKNVSAGAVGLKAAFPSGHLTPPAHGGCTCTLTDTTV